MRNLPLIVVALSVVACGSSTEPSKAKDPSLLFTNELSTPVYLTWQDGQAILGRDTVPPFSVNRCSRFVAQPDSAYFHIEASQNLGGTIATSTYTAPYFDPAARPAWTVHVFPIANGSPGILVALVDSAC